VSLSVLCVEGLFLNKSLRQSLAHAPLVLLLGASAVSQSVRIQNSHTTESLRGISAVSRDVAWASGTHGTYLRTTDGGATWIPSQVPGAPTLDFRAVVAFSADEAFLMSAGPGDQSRIYHTADAGRHWQLEFTNTNSKGFFDSMVFWDSKHGVVLGDPIPDENGKLKFELLQTDDGQTWRPIPPSQLPAAIEGEGAFAASNTCLAILRSDTGGTSFASAPAHDPKIWFATGGKVTRVFHSPDAGRTWEVFDTPIAHGPDSAGIFSIAFHNHLDGAIAGGDYKNPNADGPNLAFTHDGGKTWTLSPTHPQAYFSAVTYEIPAGTGRKEKGAEKRDEKVHPGVFVVAQTFVVDLRRSPPRRWIIKDQPTAALNAISAIPRAGAFLVGAKGLIAQIP
jgi:photosystem II stability/assembly factor-like uncharacterized protein